MTTSTRRRTVRALAASALAMAMASVPGAAHAQQFVNPGFETGDATGWSLSGGYWQSGAWPPNPSEYSGPATQDQIMTAGSVDAITGAPTVFAGNYSMRLNNLVNDYSITAMSQSVTNYSGNKLYYAWNAVLEPSHGATDSPSFIIKVTDKTTGQTINYISYSAYTAQNTNIFRNVGGYVTSDWKVEDIDMTSGHDYEMLFIALDCPYGGHTGYVYVDSFGNAIPVPNAGVNFDVNTDITRGSTVLIPIGGNEIDASIPFYLLSQLIANQVNPVFNGGVLRIDVPGLDYQAAFTVNVAGGTIDTDGNDITFSGGFTGTGRLTKTGLGVLRFTLAPVVIDGGFDLNGGSVYINSSLITSLLRVGAGTTLGGSGSVAADIQVLGGGRLSPGNSPGTLVVAGGDVTFADSSVFLAEIDGRNYSAAGGAGSYDRVALMAGATLDPNGILTPVLRGISGGNNNFTPVLGDSFRIVSGGAIGSGAFDSVTQPATGLAANTRLDVLYNPTSIDLVVTPGSFGTLGTQSGWSGNAVATASALDLVRPTAGARSGPLLSTFNGLYGMNAVGLGGAFSQLSGEIHADVLQTVQTTARGNSQIALGAAADTWGCAPQDSHYPDKGPEGQEACGPQAGRTGPTVWGQYSGVSIDADGDATSSGFRTQPTRGFAMGVNVVNQDGTRLGIGGRFLDGGIVTASSGRADIEQAGLFAYASHRFGDLALSGALGWSRGKVDTSRSVALLNGTGSITDDYKTSSVTAALEARYDIGLGGRSVIRPVAGIEYARTRANAVAETSGTANLALTMGKETWESVRTKLGAEVGIGVGNPVEANLFANWRHELKDTTAVRTANLGPASWQVSSVVADEDAVEAGARINIKASNAVRLTLGYAISRDGAYNEDRATAGVAVRF